MSETNGYMDTSDAQKKLESSPADAMHKGITVGLNTIPIFGGLAAEIFSAIIAPPIEKRRDEFILALGEGLEALEKKYEDFNIKSVLENEDFNTTLLHVVPIAIRNHHKEKLKALRNAVLNAALPSAPDDNLQRTFVQWIDELTVWHLQLLRLFEGTNLPRVNLDNPDWPKTVPSFGALVSLIEESYPDMAGQHGMYTQYVKDLHSRGLIANFFPEPHRMTRRTTSPELTPLARKFLQYIKSPLDED